MTTSLRWAIGFFLTFVMVSNLSSPIIPVRAHVVGIDLGSDFIKVASVRRSDGIDIVLNEQTRRKTPHVVGFRGKDSYIGEDAKNLVGRFPDLMIGMLNRLVGVIWHAQIDEWYHREMLYTNPVTLTPDNCGVGVSIARDPKLPSTTYAAEMLLGMVFDYIRSMTSNYINERCTKQDAVVIVPYFFDMQQRRSLAQSASLGNTNIVATIHTTTAIALQYGVQNRGFGSKTTNVLVLDVGASKAEAGVYTFSPAPAEVKRSDSLGTLTTKTIEADPFLGGRTFDVCIAEMIAEDFEKKSGLTVLSDATTIDARKGIAVLMRSANRAKETLSSNKECPITVEGIVKGRDHSMIVRRSDFEERASMQIQRVVSLVERAITKSGLRVEDIHAFEVHGGGVRIPKLLDTLAEKIGRPMQRTLNGDEAAVFGAAFHAARVSGTFGVKGFAMHESMPYNITFALSPKPTSDGEAHQEPHALKQRALFDGSGCPSKKSVSVNRSEDFQTTFFDQDGQLQVLKVTRVHDILARLGHFEETRHPKNTFSIRMDAKLDGCGVLGVSSVKLKYTEFKDPDIAVPEGVEDHANEMVEDIEPVKHELPLDVDWEYTGRRPLSTTEFEMLKRSIKEQEAYEAAKRAVAQARNDLEALLIGYEGEALEALETAVQLTTEQKELLTSTISEIKEWFYDGDGLCEDTPLDSFRSRQQEITTIVDRIRYESTVATHLDEGSSDDPLENIDESHIVSSPEEDL